MRCIHNPFNKMYMILYFFSFFFLRAAIRSYAYISRLLHLCMYSSHTTNIQIAFFTLTHAHMQDARTLSLYKYVFFFLHTLLCLRVQSFYFFFILFFTLFISFDYDKKGKGNGSVGFGTRAMKVTLASRYM